MKCDRVHERRAVHQYRRFSVIFHLRPRLSTREAETFVHRKPPQGLQALPEMDLKARRFDLM